MGLFSIGTASAKNQAGVYTTRFFGGVFGSAPISNVAAALGDFYGIRTRGTAMAFYTVCVVGGPTLAPVAGAAITMNPNLGWRWTQYVQAIVTFFAVIVAFFFLPETYNPVLLNNKAARLRATTGDQRYWHPHENEKMNLDNIITKHLSRPLR